MSCLAFVIVKYSLQQSGKTVLR